MSIILGVLNEGLIYALMALGVYITYTILDFPDLSVDSTFPMGAAVTATLILAGMPPVLTLFIAFGAGALAGTVTGLIHVKLKVRDLLSGIIVMTALYSLNLRITGDKANLPIFSRDTIFDNEFVYGLGILVVFLVLKCPDRGARAKHRRHLRHDLIAPGSIVVTGGNGRSGTNAAGKIFVAALHIAGVQIAVSLQL